MDKKSSRNRAVYAYSNWPTVIIDKETTAFVDAMMSKSLIFQGRSSRSKKRVEKHYEQFRSKQKRDR